MSTIRKSRRITLKDVAERAKVSVAAASMALADHPEISPRTKDRVLEVSRRLGYATRRETRAGLLGGGAIGAPLKQQRFGFLLIGGRLEDEAFSGMLHALLVGAAQLDTRVEVSAIEDASDPKAVGERAMAYAKDLGGLILMGEAHPTLLDELHRASIPHTVIGYVPGEFGEPLSTPVQIVTTDEEAMGRLATTALLDAGHRRIGFICERLIPGLIYERWLGGYALAHLSRGMSIDIALVQIAGQIHVGGRPAAEAFGAMREPPTGFVAPDARTGASFLQAMRDRGVEVKPSDIVIGGQDFVVKRYGLEGYPQVLEDLPKMASIALEHLRGLCRHPAVHAAEILVPFATRNLPTR